MNVLSSNMIKNFSCGRLFKRRKFKINEINLISEQEQYFIDMQNYLQDDLSMNYESDCQFSEQMSDNISEDASISNSEDDQLSLTKPQLELEEWDTNIYLQDNVTQLSFEAFIQGGIMLQGATSKVFN